MALTKLLMAKPVAGRPSNTSPSVDGDIWCVSVVGFRAMRIQPLLRKSARTSTLEASCEPRTGEVRLAVKASAVWNEMTWAS